MKVHVDTQRCEAQAVCVGLAPKVFELGDDDDTVRVVVDEVPEELRKRVLRAVEKCPKAALSVEG